MAYRGRMDITSREIADRAKANILALASAPEYGTQAAVRDAVAKLSGVSSGRIRLWVEGRNENLSIKTLDNIVSAVNKLRRVTA